jgi:stage V sporulation protein SpoVS
MSNDDISPLKVKADPPDASPAEKSRSSRKLAGAIAHSLRRHGEVPLRCFGNGAIGKGAWASAVASQFLSGLNLELLCVPAFIAAEMDGIEKTGLSFLVYAEEEPEEPRDFEDEAIPQLWVKSDRPGVSSEERKKAVKKLGGAIAHNLRETGVVAVRCFGNYCIGKGGKACAIARGNVAVHGYDLYMIPRIIEADMGDERKRGIAYYVIAEGGQ